MASEVALQKAAQAWCTPATSNRVMDPELAEAFADILDGIWNQPWLGNATTRELLTEISARVDLDYKTTTGERATGCNSNADYIIQSGPRPDDFTCACVRHVGYLLTDGAENRILPVETPMDSSCCYIKETA